MKGLWRGGGLGGGGGGESKKSYSNKNCADR